MARAIHINANTHTVEEITAEGLADMQNAVGGYIEAAVRFGNGDTLFVDEEGLLKNQDTFFALVGETLPLAGSGIVVGGEDEEGNLEDAQTTVEWVKARVMFMTPMQALQMLHEKED